MFRTVQEVFEYLVNAFRRDTGKFPIGQQIDDLMNKAKEYMSKPQITTVDERKLPRADIKALPLQDKEKAEAALKKTLEAQNEQARQSIKGGESPGGPQRGRPELVDETFGDTIYIDKSEMGALMDQAYRSFDAADDAIRRGDYADARGILRYEIEENYKFPKATRDAAYDARVFMFREGGLDMNMGYDTEEEILEVIKEKIDEGMQTTMPRNYPTFTNPDDASKMKNIEYVDYLDEPGEDFGTPNSIISTPEDMGYDFKDGGRVGMAVGGIMRLKQLLDKAYEMVSSRGDFDFSDYKMRGQLMAEELSELKFGKDYYDLDLKTQMDLYEQSSNYLNDVAEDAADNLLDRMKEGRKSGGRVGFAVGGIINLINKLVKSKKLGAERAADLIDLMDQAKKAGVPIKTMDDLKNFEKQIKKTSEKVYESRKKFPGVGGEKSGLPLNLKERKQKAEGGLSYLLGE